MEPPLKEQSLGQTQPKEGDKERVDHSQEYQYCGGGGKKTSLAEEEHCKGHEGDGADKISDVLYGYYVERGKAEDEDWKFKGLDDAAAVFLFLNVVFLKKSLLSKSEMFLLRGLDE